MNTITKKDLIDRISVETKLRRHVAKAVVQRFLAVMVEELGEGRRIEFRDFGVFEIKTRAARAAQNPKTLQRVLVPSRKTVKFKAGRLLRDRLGKTGTAKTDAENTPTPRSGKGVTNGLRLRA